MGGQTSTTKTENKPPAWAVPLFEQSASEAQRIYDSGAGGNVYRGDTTAGLGRTTLAGISGVQAAASSLPATSSSGTNLLDMASGAQLRQGNPYFNEALQGQLDDTAAQVQSQFSGSGRYGSGANTAVLTKQLGNIRANAMYNQYNQDTANMLTANNLVDQANSNLYQNKLSGSQATIKAGQLQDAAKQADLDAALARFQATDNQDWIRLGLLQAAASGSAGNYGTGVQTQRTSGNPLSVIGGIGSLATKSDRRLKENIEEVGEKNGFQLYEWNYIGGEQRYRGVMAQDVIQLRPDAIEFDSEGFMAVRYDLLGIEMEAV